MLVCGSTPQQFIVRSYPCTTNSVTMAHDEQEENSSQISDEESSEGSEVNSDSTTGPSNISGTDKNDREIEDDEKRASSRDLAAFLGKFKRPELELKKKRLKKIRSQFIDDEAELSGDDEVSEDELENSDDDENDLDLVDQEAPELDSEDEEKVRKLYHKQLETEDRRAVLLLQEQFEDNDVAIGQRRRRKFRWQAKEMMENSLRRHYDPDDDDSQDCEDDDVEDFEFDDINPRLRRPTAETLLLGSTRLITKKDLEDSPVASTSGMQTSADKSSIMSEDTNSTSTGGQPAVSSSNVGLRPADMTRYLFRDKELVQALSKKETVVVSREVRDKNIQREIQKMIHSKSIFDSLYS